MSEEESSKKGQREKDRVVDTKDGDKREEGEAGRGRI